MFQVEDIFRPHARFQGHGREAPLVDMVRGHFFVGLARLGAGGVEAQAEQRLVDLGGEQLPAFRQAVIAGQVQNDPARAGIIARQEILFACRALAVETLVPGPFSSCATRRRTALARLAGPGRICP